MSAESTGSDPYEVVLADLRAKKAQIDQAINAIEALRGGAASVPSGLGSGQGNPPQDTSVDSPGAFLGLSIVDAAKKLLAARRQPLKNPDIYAAFKRGGLVMNSKDPINTVGSVLSRRAAEVGDVVKVGRGVWGLKEWYPNRSFRRPDARDAGKGDEALDLEPTGTVASVPFVMTQTMRENLSRYGKTDDQIREMTPKQAADFLSTMDDVVG